MIEKTRLRAIALLLLLCVVPAMLANAESSENCPGPKTPTLQKVSLPDSLEQCLVEKLPEYRVVRQEDYSADWFDGNHEDVLKSLHWAVRADFDGNAIDDYAFLMVGRLEGKRQIALVAARSLADGWSLEVLRSYPSDREVTDRIDLELAGPVFMGFDENGQERTESLSCTSLVVGGLKQCLANRYYWKDGKWQNAYIRL